MKQIKGIYKVWWNEEFSRGLTMLAGFKPVYGLITKVEEDKYWTVSNQHDLTIQILVA